MSFWYFLTKREIQVRYKQTVLGGLWAIIQPLFTMAVFTLFFGRLAKMPSDGIVNQILFVIDEAELFQLSKKEMFEKLLSYLLEYTYE